jgi:hypothetical protein
VERESGPGYFIPLVPVRRSRWPFRRWSQRPEATDYRIEGDTVVYRGLRLRSGDIVLVNLAIDRDGLFTALSATRPTISHTGIFVMIHKDGRSYPAVLELHELGVRAVPLSVALSAKMVSYAEIYRLREPVPADWSEQLSEVALELLNSFQHYDFNTTQSDANHMTCPDLPNYFYGRTGRERFPGNSTMAPETQPNLKKLGLQIDRFLSPDDYSSSERLELAGWIDNGHFECPKSGTRCFPQCPGQLPDRARALISDLSI